MKIRVTAKNYPQEVLRSEIKRSLEEVCAILNTGCCRK